MASGGLLVTFGAHWLVKRHPYLCLRLHVAFSPCTCVANSPLTRMWVVMDQVIRPYFNLIASLTAPSPDKDTPETLGVRTLDMNSGGTQGTLQKDSDLLSLQRGHGQKSR